MPYPALISSTLAINFHSATCPCGPFVAGAANKLYVPLLDTVNRKVAMMRSVDLGLTWAEVDSGGRPTYRANLTPSAFTEFGSLAGALVPPATSADFAQIYIAYAHSIDSTIHIKGFDTQTDTWTTDHGPGPLANQFGTAVTTPADETTSLTRFYLAYRQSDNSLICLHWGQVLSIGPYVTWTAPSTNTTGSLPVSTTQYTRFSLAGLSWGSPVNVGVGVFPPSGQVDPSVNIADTPACIAPMGIVAGESGRLHFFMLDPGFSYIYNSINIPNYVRYWHCALEASGSLGPLQVVLAFQSFAGGQMGIGTMRTDAAANKELIVPFSPISTFLEAPIAVMRGPSGIAPAWQTSETLLGIFDPDYPSNTTLTVGSVLAPSAVADFVWMAGGFTDVKKFTSPGVGIPFASKSVVFSDANFENRMSLAFLAGTAVGYVYSDGPANDLFTPNPNVYFNLTGSFGTTTVKNYAF